MFCPFLLYTKVTQLYLHSFFFFFVFFAISWAAPTACGVFQARGRIGAAAAGLHQSHGNVGSEPCLRPTPQLTAMPDGYPTEQGQGSNPQSQGSQSDSLTTAPQRELTATPLTTEP